MKALILGATGGSGQAIALELVSRGISTILFGRNREKLDRLAAEWGGANLFECIEGDVYKVETLVPAFKKTEIVFQCANGGYVGMVESLPRLASAVMRAAEETGRKVVFVDGVYVYGKSPGYAVNEDFPMKPHTRKGQAKLAFALEVLSDRWKKARTAIVRLPDYYGAVSQLAFLDPIFKGFANGKPAIFIGNQRIAKEYVYLPDAAKMIVNIALRDESYGQSWHIPGTGQISGREIIQICERITGRKIPVISFGPIAVNLIGLFDPFCRELSEMMYQWDQPIVLDGSKYEREIGPVPRTPFEIGFSETLEALNLKVKGTARRQV